MTDRTRGALLRGLTGASLLLATVFVISQATQRQASAASAAARSETAKDRWLHVRIQKAETKDETVRVNVPLEMAEKVLPAIHKDRLRSGKVKLDDIGHGEVDVRAVLDAVRTAKDGEFVTVESKDADVKVSKQSGYLYVHVVDKNRSDKKTHVEVKLPMKVVDAMFSGDKDELDLVAGLRALSGEGDMELVSVKDRQNTVRVWLDSKNISE